jgi:hypothetical protein
MFLCQKEGWEKKNFMPVALLQLVIDFIITICEAVLKLYKLAACVIIEIVVSLKGCNV